MRVISARGVGRHQPELRALVAGQDVRVGVGGDARDHAHQHVLRAPGRHVASSRSTSSALSTTTSPMPCSTAIAISSSPLALPWWTISAGSTPAFSAVRISPPPATSSPSPSSTITRWTAVAGNALEANTTRERGQRARQLRPVLARPGAQRGLGDDQRGRAELLGQRVGAAAADAQHPVAVAGAAGWEEREEVVHARALVER